jgi:hypothetical protein
MYPPCLVLAFLAAGSIPAIHAAYIHPIDRLRERLARALPRDLNHHHDSPSSSESDPNFDPLSPSTVYPYHTLMARLAPANQTDSDGEFYVRDVDSAGHDLSYLAVSHGAGESSFYARPHARPVPARPTTAGPGTGILNTTHQAQGTKGKKKFQHRSTKIYRRAPRLDFMNDHPGNVDAGVLRRRDSPKPGAHHPSSRAKAKPRSTAHHHAPTSTSQTHATKPHPTPTPTAGPDDFNDAPVDNDAGDDTDNDEALALPKGLHINTLRERQLPSSSPSSHPGSHPTDSPTTTTSTPTLRVRGGGGKNLDPTPAPTGPSSDLTTIHISSETDFSLILPQGSGQPFADAEDSGTTWCYPGGECEDGKYFAKEFVLGAKVERREGLYVQVSRSYDTLGSFHLSLCC